MTLFDEVCDAVEDALPDRQEAFCRARLLLARIPDSRERQQVLAYVAARLNLAAALADDEADPS